MDEQTERVIAALCGTLRVNTAFLEIEAEGHEGRGDRHKAAALRGQADTNSAVADAAYTLLAELANA